MTTRRTDANDVFHAALAAASLPPSLPGAAFDPAADVLVIGSARVPTGGLRRIVILGAGKAARGLAEAVAVSLVLHGPPGCAVEGLVLVPERGDDAGPTRPRPTAGIIGPDLELEVLEVRPPDANAPTDAAVAATERVVAVARGLRPDDLLLCALTGGGSATLCAPAPGLTLADKSEAVRLLTADGATIDEINTLRRHLSAVKGGRLAEAARGARAIVSLLVSDVDGDRPHVIASGPAVPDPTTFRDALDLREEWPPAVLRHLQAGCRGEVPETPKTLPTNVAWQVVRSPDDALRGAAECATALGWKVHVIPRPTPARLDACVAAHLDAVRRAAPGTAVLSVGEAPLALPPCPPAGGRAGHLALALAVALDADPRLRGRTAVLVGATDGEDGSSGTGGGFVDADVLRAAQSAGLDPARLLERCDSLAVLRAGGGVVPRGVTGTNVQDLRIVLVGDAPPGETA